jgi:hypothetical protein
MVKNNEEKFQLKKYQGIKLGKNEIRKSSKQKNKKKMGTKFDKNQMFRNEVENKI